LFIQEVDMKRLGLCLGIGLLLAVVPAQFGLAQSKTHGFVTPNDVAWGPAPPSLPPGAQAALLEGDPAKEGPFTLRLRLPDGYRVAPHFHPAVEHITVLEGTFIVGMGDKAATDGERPLGAGSFAFMPAGMRHFVRTKGDTVVQLHGVGPWAITYVNPADDPRKK
jgi:quercetin dioxygenase-like cupin family protein